MNVICKCGKKYARRPGVWQCKCGAKWWVPPLCWHRRPNPGLTVPSTWHLRTQPCIEQNQWKDDL